MSSKTEFVSPVVRPADAHLYPAWWPKMIETDWHRVVQEARTAAFVPDLGLVADSSLARTGGANGWLVTGSQGAVHWCFDLRGDAPAWARANVDAIRSEQE